MRTARVLPFPTARHFTRDDHLGLQRFAAAFPNALIDIIVGRDRREIAILGINGHQLWLSRVENSIHIRNVLGGRRVAVDISMADVLAAFQADPMDGGASAWSDGPKLRIGRSRLPLAGE